MEDTSTAEMEQPAVATRESQNRRTAGAAGDDGVGRGNGALAARGSGGGRDLAQSGDSCGADTGYVRLQRPANWTPATVPTGTAFFGASNSTALTFSTDATVGGWTFNAGASAYTFTNNQSLDFNGAGIVINGGSATINNNVGSILNFISTSTAGNATINNRSDFFEQHGGAPFHQQQHGSATPPSPTAST